MPKRGCLLIHGFTSTPATMAPLKDALIAKGYRVAMPLLAGHGGSYADLEASTRQDWYDTVRTSFTALRREVDKVYCAGMSLGALLGMRLAIDEGWGVRALALLSMPFRFPAMTRMEIACARYSPLKWLLRSIRKNLANSVAYAEGRKLYANFTTLDMPVKSIFEIHDLQADIRDRIGGVSNPLLLLHGRRDPTAPPFNAELVRRGASSDVIETHIYDRSKHVLTFDWDREDVTRRVVDFFERFS